MIFTTSHLLKLSPFNDVLIKKIYKKKINIAPSHFNLHLSKLSNKKFVNLTHYKSSSWDKMINYTKKFHE